MKQLIYGIRSILTMKLMSIVLWISPHGEKAEFAGFIYKHYGSMQFDLPDTKEEK